MQTKWITNTLGQSFLIDSEDKYMSRVLQGKGYQIKNWQYAQTLLKNSRTALDIGASVGMNTVNYSETFDWVEAFEPDPDVYNCLLETVVANGVDNAHTHNIAAHNTSTTNTLVKFPRATFANCLMPIGYKGRSRPQIKTQCETIDSYDFETVDFIKIDVEGWEMAVLEGCEQTITQCEPVVQVEIKPQMLKRANTTAEDIWAWFAQRGYSCVHPEGTVDTPTTVAEKIVFPNITKNLVDFWFVK